MKYQVQQAARLEVLDKINLLVQNLSVHRKKIRQVCNLVRESVEQEVGFFYGGKRWVSFGIKQI